MRVCSRQCSFFLFILKVASGFSFSKGPLVSLRHRSISNSKLYLDGEGMAGSTFNKHILGDIIRALQPSYLSQVKKSIAGNLKGMQTLDLEPFLNFQSTGTQAGLISWEELANTLRQQQTSQEKAFRSKLEQGLIHSPLASHRVFNSNSSPESNVSVTFYRDSAAWCPYCQKVYIALEEKQIPYKVIKVDMNSYAGSSKPADFLRIQPSGSLPCVSIHREGDQSEDQVIQQSDDILAAIDALGSNTRNSKVPSLLPESQADIEYMKFLCDDGRNSLERRLYAEWLWYLTGKRRPVEYRQRFESILDEVDSTLSSTPGPFFVGEFSMADIKFIPFVERQAASLLYFKGFNLRDSSRWPYIVKWLEAMEKRPSYLVTKSDVYTHSRALPPQLSAGCEFYEGCEERRDAVDVYCLPTTNASSSRTKWREEGWGNYYKDTQVAQREAAERIIYNHMNIIKFAARAAGTPGFPAAAAELSDPKAQANEDAIVAIDIFLRHTINLLLAKNAGQRRERLKLVSEGATALSGGGEETVQAIIDCLDYLRMRIGVPRDMSYPSAHELREALLDVSVVLLEAKMGLLSDQKMVNLDKP